MWWLAASLALAAVPSSVDLEELDLWEDGADRLLDGPEGCWEIVGQATWDWDVGRFGGSRGGAVFVGRLHDGVWSEVHLRSLGEVRREPGRKGREVLQYAQEPRFAPLVGSLEGGRITVSGGEGSAEVEVERDPGDGAAENLVRNVLRELGGRVDTAWTQWDDARQAVVLHRSVPIGEGANAPEARVEVVFPGGQPLPDAMTVRFPERFFRGTLPRIRIEDAVVEVRGRISQGSIFPTSEAFRFDFGFLGMRFSGAQTITYKSAVRCPGDRALAVPLAAPEPLPEPAVEPLPPVEPLPEG